jgi:hypothetical protein
MVGWTCGFPATQSTFRIIIIEDTMKIALALTFAGICSLAIGGCSSSDTKKLTNDAKTTGEAVKQTASDAADATKRAVDTASDDAKKAANSDTAKDIKEKTERGARRVVDKTKQAAQDAKDAINKPAPPTPPKD